MPRPNDPRYHSGYYSGYPQHNVRTYTQSHPSSSNQGFNSAIGLRNLSRREQDEAWRRSQARVADPHCIPRQRSGDYVTVGNIHAAENSRGGRSRRNTGVYDMTNMMAGMSMGDRGSRGRSVRASRSYNHCPAPEPPRINPRNAEYHLNRVMRPSNTNQDNYNDAYRYINGRHPNRRTDPAGGRRNPRGHAGLNGGRTREPESSRWDRLRRWF